MGVEKMENKLSKKVGQRGSEIIKNQENLDTLRKKLGELIEKYSCLGLEEKTGVSDSSIKAIATGERSNPKIDNLISIAKGSNYSIDFLVGLSSDNTTDLEKREVCEMTGLSVEALDNLILILSDSNNKKHINDILENLTMLISLSDNYRSFIEFNPVEEDINDLLRRRDKEDVLLKRLNDQLITFKNLLPETIDSLRQLKSFYQEMLNGYEKESSLLQKEFEADRQSFLNNPDVLAKFSSVNKTKMEINSRLAEIDKALLTGSLWEEIKNEKD